MQTLQQRALKLNQKQQLEDVIKVLKNNMAMIHSVIQLLQNLGATGMEQFESSKRLHEQEPPAEIKLPMPTMKALPGPEGWTPTEDATADGTTSDTPTPSS